MKVKVKWGKQLISDVDLNPEEPPMVLKNKLYEITGVPPDRQKLLLKGIDIKDSWSNVNLAPNCSFLLVGSKEALPSGPATQTLFIEDMSDSELSRASNLPPGLTNLGNTCYLNATLQCLRTVPELRTALKSLGGQFLQNEVSKKNLVISLRDQFELMDKCLTAPPIGLVHSLHSLMPQFSEKDDLGKWKQQDANEFWVEMISILNDVLAAHLDVGYKNIINQYFSGIFEVTYKCMETESELPIINEEAYYQLSCFINPDTKFLQFGLQSNLTEKITKHSTVLNRDAVYEKICKIKRLPAYLTIQLVRFFYKEKEKINAKILRDVKFPLLLDVHDLCTSDLQSKLSKMREKIKKAEDEAALNKNGEKLTDIDDLPHESFSFEDDIGSSNSGLYCLRAILTHKGRSSSSGHYVAWVSQGGKWLMCDDSNVSIVTKESVLQLSGGGDWHTAYILLYGPRLIPSDDSKKN